MAQPLLFIDPMTNISNLVSERIYVIRGHRVMLDYELAELYSVLTKNLNKAVQRNIERFPMRFVL